MNNRFLFLLFLYGLSALLPMIAMEGEYSTKGLKLDTEGEANSSSLDEPPFTLWKYLPKDIKGEIILASLSSQLSIGDFTSQITALLLVNKETGEFINSNKKIIKEIQESYNKNDQWDYGNTFLIMTCPGVREHMRFHKPLPEDEFTALLKEWRE